MNGEPLYWLIQRPLDRFSRRAVLRPALGAYQHPGKIKKDAVLEMGPMDRGGALHLAKPMPEKSAIEEWPKPRYCGSASSPFSDSTEAREAPGLVSRRIRADRCPASAPMRQNGEVEEGRISGPW